MKETISKTYNFLKNKFQYILSIVAIIISVFSYYSSDKISRLETNNNIRDRLLSINKEFNENIKISSRIIKNIHFNSNIIKEIESEKHSFHNIENLIHSLLNNNLDIEYKMLDCDKLHIEIKIMERQLSLNVNDSTFLLCEKIKSEISHLISDYYLIDFKRNEEYLKKLTNRTEEIYKLIGLFQDSYIKIKESFLSNIRIID